MTRQSKHISMGLKKRINGKYNFFACQEIEYQGLLIGTSIQQTLYTASCGVARSILPLEEALRVFQFL
jgi:hypothetical protein